MWVIIHGTPPAGEVDHIDGDPLNNRPENLRLATSGQNNHNRRLSERNKSGVKGVIWVERHKRWRGLVVHKGHQHFVGNFTELRAAEAAVIAKRQELHGDFARHE